MNIFKYVCAVFMMAVFLMAAPGISNSEDAGVKPADNAPVPEALKQPVKPAEPTVIISTKYGDIVIKFRPDVAPKHVENFITLAKKGFYNKTIFHRVIPGFMIQGGDPNTKGSNTATYGQGGPGHTVMAEFSKVSHKRGIVSMARSNDPNSAGSQFFIVVADSTFLDGKYTVFGEVVKGMDVADKIVKLPRNRQDLPNERVEMTVKIVE